MLRCIYQTRVYFRLVLFPVLLWKKPWAPAGFGCSQYPVPLCTVRAGNVCVCGCVCVCERLGPLCCNTLKSSQCVLSDAKCAVFCYLFFKQQIIMRAYRTTCAEQPRPRQTEECAWVIVNKAFRAVGRESQEVDWHFTNNCYIPAVRSAL